MKGVKRLLIVSCCALTACAPLRPPGEVPQTPNTLPKTPLSRAETPAVDKALPLGNHVAEVNTISSWEIRGSMVAKTKGKGWSALLNWTQHGPNAYQIRLIGPLGGGSVLISRSSNKITLQDGKNLVSSTDASELLYKETGVRVPVTNLYYWVRGLPAPGRIQGEQRDPSNHLIQLKQNGYVVSFMQYTTVKGLTLPSSIRLEGNGIMVKVTIRSWAV